MIKIYSSDLQKLWGKWLRARFRFANHLARVLHWHCVLHILRPSGRRETRKPCTKAHLVRYNISSQKGQNLSSGMILKPVQLTNSKIVQVLVHCNTRGRWLKTSVEERPVGSARRSKQQEKAVEIKTGEQRSRLKPSYEFHFEGLSNFSLSIEELVQIQDVNPRIQKWN